MHGGLWVVNGGLWVGNGGLWAVNEGLWVVKGGITCKRGGYLHAEVFKLRCRIFLAVGSPPLLLRQGLNVHLYLLLLARLCVRGTPAFIGRWRGENLDPHRRYLGAPTYIRYHQCLGESRFLHTKESIEM